MSPSPPPFHRQSAPRPRSRPPRAPLHEVFPPAFRPTASSPRPPGTDVPPTSEVPLFPPVRVRGGWYGFRRFVRRCVPVLAAGLAVTAAALAVTGPRTGTDAHPRGPARGRPVADTAPRRPAPRPVAAPVRIADAATVRLLRPGDRVDVIAAGGAAADGDARVIARGARVAEVPGTGGEGDGDGGNGALVVLSVPRSTAARLVGASATARLAVTLC